MTWTKMGRVFDPSAQGTPAATHAALPVLDADALRLYFSSRDERGRSHIRAADLTFDPLAVRGPGAPPILGPGELGTFDDAGVTSSCIVRHAGRTFLYYTGWSLGVTVPFYLQAGLAVNDGGPMFRRLSAAPLLDRNAVDPYLTASPWVMVDGSTWRMWYVSGTAWERIGPEVRHRYHIKYAESPDGIHWVRAGVVSIDYATTDEYAFGRPCVLKEDGVYRMWYSCRGEHYQIGYAESNDGVAWTRKDAECGLAVSAEGWDSEMTTYPFVFRHQGQLHMLYNGNGYGRSGIGLAIEA